MPLELERLQKRFWQFMTAPTGVSEAKAVLSKKDPGASPISSWIAIDSESRAVERLDVYANMYFFRLRDLLAEDFDSVAKLIGEAHFHNLITDYLLEHPSTDPNIRNVGARLPDFLETHALIKDWPYLADLARFDWALMSVFDAKDSAPLEYDDLVTIDAEAWPTTRLHVTDALTLLSTRYAIHEIRNAIREGSTTPSASEQRTTYAIWRRGFRVHYRPMLEPEVSAFKALESNATFGEVCAHFADDLDINRAAGAARETLLRWLGDGLLKRADAKEKKK